MSASNNRFVQGVNLADESSALLLRHFKLVLYWFVPVSILIVSTSHTSLLFFITNNDSIVKLVGHSLDIIAIVCPIFFINQLAKAQNLTPAPLNFKLFHSSIAIGLSYLLEHLIKATKVCCSEVPCRITHYIVSLIIGGGLFIVFPAIVVGACSITQAIQRSFATLYTKFWTIVGGALFFGLISGVIGLPVFILATYLFPCVESPILALLGALLMGIAVAVIAALWATFKYLLYVKTYIPNVNGQ